MEDKTDLTLELITKVLKKNIVSFKERKNDISFLYMIDDSGFIYNDTINTCDFYAKCKRWAYSIGYALSILPYKVILTKIETNEKITFEYSEEDIETDEPYLEKYVFQACGSIINKKGIQNV